MGFYCNRRERVDDSEGPRLALPPKFPPAAPSAMAASMYSIVTLPAAERP